MRTRGLSARAARGVLPAELAERAYEDAPLPIGHDQTISQPYIVAVTVAALDLRPAPFGL